MKNNNAPYISEVETEPSAHLVTSEDDYSIRVSSEIDKRFWLRAEKGSPDGTLVITDFTVGDRPLEELEAGVLIATRVLEYKNVHSLVFLDLMPTQTKRKENIEKLAKTMDLVKRLADVVAMGLNTLVVKYHLRRRSGKIDAQFYFKQQRGHN